MYRYNKKRMQGGGQPVQQGGPQMAPVPQQQPQRPQMNVQQQPQGGTNPCDQALTMVLTENEKLKHQVEKHKEAWEIMCAEKTRRYNELMAEKNTLECEIRYAKMDGKI